MARAILSSRKNSRKQAGFTLIEVILDAFVITVIFGAVIGSFLVMLNATNSGRIRTLAGALANEQMEYLRNLPYDSLSTQQGTILPQGTIPDAQNITRGGVTFTLSTTIIFVDDQLDGCAIPTENPTVWNCTDGSTSPTFDSVPVDYKRINVEALKIGTPTVLTKLSSNAAAKAAETPSNTGMLLVKVTDAGGLPVSGATVTVTSTIMAQLIIIATTNDQGYVFISNLTPDNQNGYHIVVTKNGYSSDFTTSRTSQNPNQVQPDVDVNIQQVTSQSLKIDKLANTTITITNETGSPVADLTVTASSDKLVATNPDTPKNIYSGATNASGVVTFSNIEWGSYSLTVGGTYLVATTSPYQPFAVDPDTTLPVTLVVTSDSNWPRITTVSPSSGTAGSVITVVISGFNFENGSTVVLRKIGSPDIIPTSTDVDANQKTITLTLDLTGVSAGDWDIVINSGGMIVTQLEGFTIS